MPRVRTAARQRRGRCLADTDLMTSAAVRHSGAIASTKAPVDTPMARPISGEIGYVGVSPVAALLLAILFYRADTRRGDVIKPMVQAQVWQGHGDMLIRVRPQQIDAAGIERTARIAGVVDGRPLTEDGVVLDVANVIWCTCPASTGSTCPA
jgi:hypothetical protein